MRAPDGHDSGGTPAPSPTPSPAPADTAAPAADATALGAGDGGDGAAEGGDATALGGKLDGDGAADGDVATKTPEELAAEAEAAKAAEVPAAYDLTAPEGMTINPADLEEATPIFKELGLSNDQANKLMPVAAKFAQRIADQANQAILAQVQQDRKAWLDTAKADPEIGGQHWDGTIKTAASALDKLGFVKGSPFRVLLDESGLGNHPEMIRAFTKVGKAIGEDSNFVRVESGGAPRSHAQVLYGNNGSK
uniref:hypothetical protein n=1 Tax=Sphingomonas sp. AR_OL41 TaxID=3042729 RepID=UPI0024805434|nr:hypothetical protein [Sphingomonas sp. AR_OL41]